MFTPIPVPNDNFSKLDLELQTWIITVFITNIQTGGKDICNRFILYINNDYVKYLLFDYDLNSYEIWKLSLHDDKIGKAEICANGYKIPLEKFILDNTVFESPDLNSFKFISKNITTCI